jgi:hypothetical protein
MPFGDRPTLSPDDEMGFAVADRRAGMLAQALALKKMDEGTYGRCEACEEEIARLGCGRILRVHARVPGNMGARSVSAEAGDPGPGDPEHRMNGRDGYQIETSPRLRQRH